MSKKEENWESINIEDAFIARLYLKIHPSTFVETLNTYRVKKLKEILKFPVTKSKKVLKEAFENEDHKVLLLENENILELKELYLKLKDSKIEVILE